MQADLAQKVADVALATIGHHVIITDERAIIIGSSLPDRRGDLHSPSLKAMTSRSEVVTTPDEALSLDRVRPGVTLPIELAGEIVGSVAIAGEPDEVARFGQLVRREAEVFLKERMLLEAELLRDGARQHLIQEIYAFAGGEMDREFLLARGREIAIDLALPRLCLVIDVTPLGPDRKNAEASERRRLAGEIEALFKRPQDLTAILGSDKFIVLPVLSGRERRIFVDAVADNCRRLRESFRRRGREVSFGIGPVADDLDDLSLSLRSAWRALVLGRRVRGEAGVFFYDDFLLDDLLAGADRRLAQAFIARSLGDLRGADDFDALKTTLRAWMSDPFHPGQVARSLGIHRNTLTYRLDKIGRLTGQDLRDFRSLFSLELALRLADYPALAERKRGEFRT